MLAEADDHPDAKGIFTRAFAHDPTLSLSTVYRTMKLLETQGAIERHAFEDGVSRYEHADQEHHDHLIDVETGTVVEFSSPEIEALQAKIAAELGYEIVRHRLELYGRKIKRRAASPASRTRSATFRHGRPCGDHPRLPR